MNLLQGFKITGLFHAVPQPQGVAPRVFPTTGFRTIPASDTVEEEHWAWYTPHSFYPVCIGDVLYSKYQVLYKLGYGTTSTIWMCRDLHRDEFVCMKSMVCDYSSVRREIDAYEALLRAAKISKAAGKRYVRQALDHFELSRGNREYQFLIHEPLGASLQFFLDISCGSLPVAYAKDLTYQMLQALEFIHSTQVIHGDLQAKNILLRIEDPTVLKDAEESEIEQPSPRKFTRETIIFEMKELPGPLERWIGRNSEPVLCDFGEARTGKSVYEELIQPAVYRAPEVFLHIPWSTPVDIWNLGCLAWDLMFGRPLFSRRGATDEQTADKNQLARMFALLGPPPPELLARSGLRALVFFDEDGLPRGEAPDETLESVLASALERTEKTMTLEESETFLAFLRRTLTWTQEQRSSPSELLKDPWLASVKF